jgi:hypothetical protein
VWTAEVIDLPGAAAVGETLEERFSGKITLRMDPSLHRLLSLAAKRHDLSLNSFIVGNLSFSAGRESQAGTSRNAGARDGTNAGDAGQR